MATQHIWIGATGMRYIYLVNILPKPIPGDHDGNYIFAKKNATGDWIPIYIGEGNLTDRLSDSHHQAACIRQKGATHGLHL